MALVLYGGGSLGRVNAPSVNPVIGSSANVLSGSGTLTNSTPYQFIIASSFTGVIGTPQAWDLSSGPYGNIDAAIPPGNVYAGLDVDPTGTALPAGWSVEP